jgi:DNA-binding LytR/AlgR family response regulator
MNQCLFIRSRREFYKLAFADIIYVESWKNYIQIVTGKNKFMIKTTITRVEKLLPENEFCRIHRGYIVSLKAITGFNHSKVHIQGKDLPISEQYRKLLLKSVITLEDNPSEKSARRNENTIELTQNLEVN